MLNEQNKYNEKLLAPNYMQRHYILHLKKDYLSITSDYHNEVDYLY